MRRRRPAAAAAGDDAMTRRRRRRRRRGVVCYGSASLSRAPTTLEERRFFEAAAHPYLFNFVSSLVLILLRVSHAGYHCRTRRQKEKCKMATVPWRFELKLDPEVFVKKMLSIGIQSDLVPAKEYCLNMPILKCHLVPGAIPQRQKDGSMVVEQIKLLAEPAQEMLHSAFTLLDCLFSSGHCLLTINDTTLIVDVRTGNVLLADEAWEEEVTTISSTTQVESTIASMGNKLKEYLFDQNCMKLEDVPEVQELFRMMSSAGSNSYWYAILNNSALVPLENRREFFIRMHEQLNIAKGANRQEYEHMLEELVFPLDWQHTISRELNGILFVLYGGAIYDATAIGKKDQADQLLRMFRNSGVHVLDKVGQFIGRSDVCLIQYAMAPRLYASLENALQKREWLASANVHTLFVYTSRRCRR